MSNEKNKPAPPKPRRADPRQAPTPEPSAADRRWQRNVRFNWDNGGRKGGRHGGRR